VNFKLTKKTAVILAAVAVAVTLIIVFLFTVKFQVSLNLQGTYFILFLTAFGLNLIPFAGPSNLLIASTAAIGLANTNTTSLLLIGLIIALAAAAAKGIYYVVTFFVNRHLSEKSRAKLDADGVKIRRWAFWLLFLAAATPIPDEPVVIPLGLMKYSPTKFFTAYFLGKLSITVAGAFLGSFAGDIFSEWLSPVAMIIISIVLTVVITIILLKVDLGKLAEKYMHRKKSQTPDRQENLNNQAPTQ
jgi:membrane protein DedA with SNARE-associated domain